MFQSVAGFDKAAKETMSKDELAAAMSQLSIGDDKYDTDSSSALYAVDFEGCMQAFLSRRAQDIYGFHTQESVNLVTTTLERFMDYLLQHDVCPEYKVQVLASRDLCREATPELWSLAEASRWLPGDFNIACSTVFGGHYFRNYDGQTSWGDEQQPGATFVGMTPDLAMEVLKFGIAGAATVSVYKAFNERDQSPNFDDRVQVIETSYKTGFEIFKIVPPSKNCLALYKRQSEDFRPVGRLYARPWQNPDAAPQDLTKDEKVALVHDSPQNAEQEYVFFVESVILNNLSIGTKIEATLHKLNCGVWFFEEVVNAYASFDTYLPNELMREWKEPKWMKGSVEFEKQQALEQAQEGTAAAEEPNKEHETNNEHDGVPAIEEQGAEQQGSGEAADPY